jgi:hypothetical protein
MERLDLSYLPAIVCVNLIYRGASSLALIAGKTRRLCKSLAGPGSNKHSCDRRPKYLQLYLPLAAFLWAAVTSSCCLKMAAEKAISRHYETNKWDELYSGRRLDSSKMSSFDE